MGSRIGLFGGSFDPIHVGHLLLARQAREELELARVIFIPTAVSPHKLHRTPAPAELRLEMVERAIAGEDGFAVDDCEVRRGGPSFTIETVRLMQRRHPGDALFYLIGADNAAALDSWAEIAELRRLVRFVVLDRGGDAEAGGPARVGRPVAVSSTEVRNRVARGQSIRYLLPDQACEVIYRNGLYQDE